MFLYEYGCTPYSDISYFDENNGYNDCLNRTSRMTEGGIEQYGYIDIKQPPRVKGRKLKSWKKKWVVLHEMSIRSAGRTAAKLDVYTDEKSAIRSPADKITFILEYVTAVRPAKSKKHGCAIEVVENDPVLLLAGGTEFETQTWLTALKQIFWPNLVENDEFSAKIIQNEHTKRLMLDGSYRMVISPDVISIQSATCNSYEWSLRMLKRFNLENHDDFPSEKVLTIECGPKSECGEASFQFRAENVAEILEAIKRNIFKAVNIKKTEPSPPTTNQTMTDKPWRTSVTSTISDDSNRIRGETFDSEQRFRDLLESPIQENKRPRLNSECSNLSRRSSDDTTALPSKKALSVTFQDVQEKNSTVDELLGATNELPNDEDEYNRVDFKTKRLPGINNCIISTFTVAKPGYQTKVLLDDKGYSHVGISVSGPVIEEDKFRSMSNISSHSSVSFRSDSTNSGDSGCQQKGIEPERFKSKACRPTSSFDSAFSMSSLVDQVESSTEKPKAETPITVEIQELEMTVEELEREQNIHSDIQHLETSIYQDVAIKDNDCEEVAKDINYLVKSRSFGDVKLAENHYEELEGFRKGKKNLVKHLGMDPQVDPKSVPPALPARPNSHKMKRKFKQSDRKLFTLPFVKSKNKKEKERQRNSSTSSESDLDEGKSREELSISAWPLGNTSVTLGNSELYQPVAIERYLKDEGDSLTPTKRERSSSLNLNTSSNTHSEFAEKSNKIWKHNRNVSMNVDLLQRGKNNDQNSFNTAFRDGFERMHILQTLGSEATVCDTSIVTDKTSEDTFDDGDEPIYAEVQPIHKKALDEPFPNMDSWKPPSPQLNKKCLDDTFYENDPLNKSLEKDLFNQGFISSQDIQSDVNKPADLIDLTFDDPSDTTENKASKSAAEIFSFGNISLVKVSEKDTETQRDASADLLDLFTLGLIPTFNESRSHLRSNTTSDTTACINKAAAVRDHCKDSNQLGEQLNESMYMDMSSCKNESVYVMPSLVKNSEI